LLLAFYSAYYEIEVPNNVVATGVVVIKDGSIKEIGGLREKVICAIKNEIDILILPQENYKSALEIANTHSKKLKIYPVSHWENLLTLLFK